MLMRIYHLLVIAFLYCHLSHILVVLFQINIYPNCNNAELKNTIKEKIPTTFFILFSLFFLFSSIFLYFYIASFINTSTFALSFIPFSPFNSSDTSTSKKSDNVFSIVISGKLNPLSHFEIALSVIFNLSPNSF